MELLSMAQVRHAADEFLNKYNQGDLLPVPIEEIAELKLGIFCAPFLGLKI